MKNFTKKKKKAIISKTGVKNFFTYKLVRCIVPLLCSFLNHRCKSYIERKHPITANYYKFQTLHATTQEKKKRKQIITSCLIIIFQNVRAKSIASSIIVCLLLSLYTLLKYKARLEKSFSRCAYLLYFWRKIYT